MAGAYGVKKPGLLIACVKRACHHVALKMLFLLCAWISIIAPSNAGETPKRLSEWLSARTISTEDYPLGLLWEVPGEAVVQTRLRSDLLEEIDSRKENAGARERMHDWIAHMPVTGRVPISIVDADWLRANPDHDPVILPGQRVILPKRPRTVTLITSKGVRCQLPHVSGFLVKRYIVACDPASLSEVDWAWVVQPDGRVSRFGIARWNAQKQDEPAPGAWIWVPYREDKWADNFSAKLTAFLATQGIPPEPEVVNIAAELGSPPVRMGEDKALLADYIVTANDWGGVGLWQTPTARMRPSSYASVAISRVYPYTRDNVFLQPFDWMEFGFRYSGISNRLYGPSIAGGQSYKDKSLDIKFRLFEELSYRPQIALGLRDIGGTGLFSGEFLVANKRIGAFDWSMGLGWGYVGGRGNLGNPLSVFGTNFNSRNTVVNQGGQFSLNSYFHGPAALFGGLQYQSGWEPLIFKLEYDGNNYRHEPLGNNLPQGSPWNIGAVYRAGSAVEVSFGFERGNTLMLALTLQADMKKLSTPKLDDPAPIPVSTSRPQSSVAGEVMARDLEKQTGWTVSGIEQNGHELRVSVDDAEAAYWSDRIDRAAAALHRDVSGEVDGFSVLQRQHGLALVEHQIDRESWVRQQTQPLPPSMQRDPVITRAAETTTSKAEQNRSLYGGSSPVFEAEPTVGLRYNLGGPNGFVLYQLYAEERAKLRLWEGTWLQGRIDLGLLDNYNHFTYDAPSNLPRVRTYIREYLTSSVVTMPNFQATHVGKLADNQYYSVYAGYLEMMFAGVGAEWMYRSFGSPVAFGIDVNRVRQRDFRQNFWLLRPAYQVDTGHATLYWDTGWNNVLATVSAGRYLAGDVGMTVDMSRVFQNGVRMGCFFTRTNVSPVQFGEGSFDKGVYLSIPFDALFTKSSGKLADILWQPLIRDGGDKLNREVQLYDVTRLLDERTMQYRPPIMENKIPVPSQVQKSWIE